MRILIDRFHEKLVKDVISEHLSDDDAMLLFCLLHCYEIEVLPEVFESSAGSSVVAPTTQRYAGEVIASLYSDHRAEYLYWYWKWNTDWGYEREERLSVKERRRIEAFKAQLETHRWVVEMRKEA